MQNTKPGYEKPQLRVVGSVSDLTQGVSDGDELDAEFPHHTPKGDLTFS
jgi:hypothetical protein